MNNISFNLNSVKYPLVFHYKNQSYVYNIEIIFHMMNHKNELFNQERYQEMIILISFLIISEIEAGIIIYKNLNTMAQQEVQTTIRLHQMKKNFLDDPNLEYGVITS